MQSYSIFVNGKLGYLHNSARRRTEQDTSFPGKVRSGGKFEDVFLKQYNMTGYTYGYNINSLTSLRISRLLVKKQTNVYEVAESLPYLTNTLHRKRWQCCSKAFRCTALNIFRISPIIATLSSRQRRRIPTRLFI